MIYAQNVLTLSCHLRICFTLKEKTLSYHQYCITSVSLFTLADEKFLQSMY